MKSLYQVLKGSSQIFFLLLLGMMVMFWIHLEVFDLQQEHAACLPLILNNWRKIRGGCCVFFLEGGYNLDSVSYSAAGYFHAFIGEKSLAAEFDDPAIN